MANSSDPAERQRAAFRALANTARYDILRMLAQDGEAHPSRELIETLGVSPPAVSNHLRIMADAGLVQTERRGVQVFVTLAATDVAYQMAALVRSVTQTQTD